MALQLGGPSPSPSERVQSHLNDENTRLESYTDRSRAASSSESVQSRKKRPKPDDEAAFYTSMMQHYDQTRQKLFALLDSILHDRPLSNSYYSYTSLVEAHCKLRSEERSLLADKVYETITKYFETNIRDNLLKEDPSESTSGSNEVTSNEYIVHFLEVYSRFESMLQLLTKLFIYLDRSYLIQRNNRKQIMEYGMNLIIEYLIVNSHSQDQMPAFLHKELSHHRSQNSEYPQYLEQYAKVLLKLNYTGHIDLEESLILPIIRNFSGLQHQWLESPETYLSNVVVHSSRDKAFFTECGYPKKFVESLTIKLFWKLIFEDFNMIIRTIAPYLFGPQHVSKLQSIVAWCKCSNQLFGLDSMPIFVYEWGQLIHREVGKIIDENQHSPKDLVLKLVSTYLEYQNIVANSLSSEDHADFEFELRSSYTAVFNSRAYSALIISALAKYCDGYFKKGTDSYSDFKTNMLLMFRCVSNKPDFLVPYKRDLSKRLLLAKTNFDQEKDLADSIISVIGNYDAGGLEDIFQDFATSKQTYSKLVSPSNIEFTPLVLQKKQWPDIPKLETNLELPPHLLTILDEFSVKYQNFQDRYQNRKLDWSNYSLHQLTIKTYFDKGPKELNVNLLQAVVLLLFTDKDRLRLTQIQQDTQMEPRLLARILNSLSSKKHPILLVKDDVYEFNSGFTDKASRIKIPLAKDNSIKAVIKESEVEVRSRKNEFTSVVMKIMKQEKEMKVTDLLNRAIEVLERRYPVAVSELKESIESLIEREFLERPDKDSLRYVP